MSVLTRYIVNVGAPCRVPSPTNRAGRLGTFGVAMGLRGHVVTPSCQSRRVTQAVDDRRAARSDTRSHAICPCNLDRACRRRFGLDLRLRLSAVAPRLARLREGTIKAANSNHARSNTRLNSTLACDRIFFRSAVMPPSRHASDRSRFEIGSSERGFPREGPHLVASDLQPEPPSMCLFFGHHLVTTLDPRGPAPPSSAMR